jgi:predicted nucleic acid-binding protein
MTGRFGIDTSVLLRLVTGEPEADLERCLVGLGAVVEDGGQVVVSNQVIGEAYIVLQQFYGATKPAARSALLEVLSRDLVSPLNGEPVLELLRQSGGPGLLDRLIVDGYSGDDLETLTLDRRMASLPRSRLL